MSLHIELVWPDGRVTTGETWAEVEHAIRAEQWPAFETRREFRQEMRKRALAWSGRPIKPGQWTPRAFIQALADAGMFMIYVTHPRDEDNG